MLSLASIAKTSEFEFDENDIREMGRSAAGVRGIKLAAKDEVISAGIVKKDADDAEILVVTRNGYGKKTSQDEYKVQNRGGSGIKTANVTDKTGELMASRIVSMKEGGEMVAISKKGQVIRIDLEEVPTLGRQTQGVRIMKLRSGDRIAALICL